MESRLRQIFGPKALLFCPGRSSDLRIILITAPSHLMNNRQPCLAAIVTGSGILQLSSPITAAGPSPILTGVPY